MQAIDAICKSKSSSESAPWEIGEARKKWISQSCRFASSGESQQQQQGRISPFRRSRAAATGVSPSRGRPHHPFQSARFNLHTIGHGNNIQHNNSNNNSAVEKTLYIDTGSTVKLCSSMLDSEETVVDEELDRRRGKEDSPTMLDSSINDDDSTKQILVVDDDDDGGGSVLCPLPPPLPKSPSESWLWRALPLVSVKNPLPLGLGAYSQSKRHDSCTTTSANNHNTKWETIVKTSNLLDDHVRCSQVIQPH